MKIVIDIPEDVYKKIVADKYAIYDKMFYSIKNGTPLPKGHGDLIDVNRKITVSTYDEQYEEWGAETLTVLEVLNKWSDEGVTAKDVIIQADKESEEI